LAPGWERERFLFCVAHETPSSRDPIRSLRRPVGFGRDPKATATLIRELTDHGGTRMGAIEEVYEDLDNDVEIQDGWQDDLEASAN